MWTWLSIVIGAAGLFMGGLLIGGGGHQAYTGVIASLVGAVFCVIAVVLAKQGARRRLPINPVRSVPSSS